MSRPVPRVSDKELPKWIGQAEAFAADNAYLGDRDGVPHVNGQPYFGAAVFDLRDCRANQKRLVEALRDLVEHGPCSDPDCCETAIANDKATQRARALLEELEADARLLEPE